MDREGGARPGSGRIVVGEIDALAADIDQRARADARVEVLCRIRGIGRYLAMLIIAEIGDIERFPRPDTCARGPA